jgi:hypothetical protein
MAIIVEPPEYEIGLASTLAIKNIKKSILLNIPMGGILAHKKIIYKELLIVANAVKFSANLIIFEVRKSNDGRTHQG